MFSFFQKPFLFIVQLAKIFIFPGVINSYFIQIISEVKCRVKGL